MPTVPGTERVPGRCHYIIMKVTGHCSVGSDLGTKIHCFPGMATEHRSVAGGRVRSGG